MNRRLRDMTPVRSLRSLYSRSLSRGRGRLAEESAADAAASPSKPAEGPLDAFSRECKPAKASSSTRGRSRSRSRMRMSWTTGNKQPDEPEGDGILVVVNADGLPCASSSSCRSRSRSLFGKKNQSSRRSSTNTTAASSGACVGGAPGSSPSGATPASPKPPVPVDLLMVNSPIGCDVIDSTPETRSVMRNISRLGMEDPVLKHFRRKIDQTDRNPASSSGVATDCQKSPHPSQTFDKQFADLPKAANAHNNVDADVEHEYLDLENDDNLSESLIHDQATVVSDHTATSQEGLDRQLFQRALLRTPSTRQDSPSERRVPAIDQDIHVSPRKVRVKIHCKSVEDLQAAVEQHRQKSATTHAPAASRKPEHATPVVSSGPSRVKETVAALEARSDSRKVVCRTLSLDATAQVDPCHSTGAEAACEPRILPAPLLQRRPSITAHEGNVSVHKSTTHPNRVVVKIRVKNKKGSTVPDRTADGEVAGLLSSAILPMDARRPSITPSSSPTELAIEKQKWETPWSAVECVPAPRGSVSSGSDAAALPQTVPEPWVGKPAKTPRHRALPSSMESIFAPQHHASCRTQRFSDERVFIDL